MIWTSSELASIKLGVDAGEIVEVSDKLMLKEYLEYWPTHSGFLMYNSAQLGYQYRHFVCKDRASLRGFFREVYRQPHPVSGANISTYQDFAADNPRNDL